MHPSLYILIAGVIVGVIGSIWLFFASYKVDRQQAHIAVFYLPMRMIKIVIEHPKECFIPFLIQLLGMILALAGIFAFISQIESLNP